MQIPYLTGAARERFDAWLETNRRRALETLTFTELRKGVRALAELYQPGAWDPVRARRALEGRAKRAAIEVFFAPLSFLTVWHAVEMIGDEALGPVATIHDVGCGTGPAAAAVAERFERRPAVRAFDRSVWAVERARATLGAFSTTARVRPGVIPGAVPRGRLGDLVVCARVGFELTPEQRRQLLLRLEASVRRGGRVLVVEPSFAETAGWWREWRHRLGALGVRHEAIRVAIVRPAPIRELDTAARLDHQVLAARVLAGGGGRDASGGEHARV